MERLNEKNVAFSKLLIPGVALSLAAMAVFSECSKEDKTGQIEENDAFRFCPSANICGEILPNGEMRKFKDSKHKIEISNYSSNRME